MKLLIVTLIASLGCEAWKAGGKDGKDEPSCQESCHRVCEGDDNCMQSCMKNECLNPVDREPKCDMKVLGDAAKFFCRRDKNGRRKCAVKCPGKLQAFFGEHKVQALVCFNGKLVSSNYGSMEKVDGPLECRKPDLDIDAIIDEVIKESPCRNERYYRCQRHSHCVPTTSGSRYTCECDTGFKLKGRVCVPIEEKVPVDDEEKCSDNFVDVLARATAHRQLKRPVSMEGENTVILQVEPNIKGSHLNGQTYTAFIEFVQNQCGTAFGKAVSDGKVEFSVYDAKVTTLFETGPNA